MGNTEIVLGTIKAEQYITAARPLWLLLEPVSISSIYSSWSYYYNSCKTKKKKQEKEKNHTKALG